MTQLRPKQVKALIGQRVVQVACGSRDAQTLALTDDGRGESWLSQKKILLVLGLIKNFDYFNKPYSVWFSLCRPEWEIFEHAKTKYSFKTILRGFICFVICFDDKANA